MTAYDPYAPDRPRPDVDLARVKLGLDWETITISGVDDAALGRIFAWLLTQVMAARGPPGRLEPAHPPNADIKGDGWGVP